ncbi:MAG: homocysteine S-methyltransferase family protein [Pseudomonadota bacterium]
METSLLPPEPKFFLTDGGLEANLNLDEGRKLPEFAAFTLLNSQTGVTALSSYFRQYLQRAIAQEAGFIFETPTWRANADWGGRLKYTRSDLAEVNADAVALMIELNQEFGASKTPVLVSGCVGPSRNGYDPGQLTTAAVAEAYHRDQVSVLAAAGADLITGINMTNTAEVIGLARAVQAVDLPVVVSFTVNTNGCLPTGQGLGAAIAETDHAVDRPPAWYMISCAHPSQLWDVLDASRAWANRIGGICVGTSCSRYAELNKTTNLNRGERFDLAQRYEKLCNQFPNIRVLGGYCGTNPHYIESITSRIVHLV